ncbi:lysylphosphatidylglycerol synthase transmembrane domain-containing protein [Sphingomonas sp. H160509]|uniref:lysylphosphatidylglycerol synthase transmembrane domain-containing protein n=1 Tax=Sphingomonas sp. H160509 TaxID=2955313 RepID=UPI0020976462|nr:lysylphosphatidylglycerol synthase transmembrane domain-containing protein [Sphingomonas sp. H160509]MDD1450228.1 lysylphosphatidylglycerol synthase transmembrane domain-containing protein [Sphingomonas sp. H160509]
MSVAALWRGVLRHIGWVLGLAVIAIVVGAVLRIGDLHAFATMLEDAHPGWLLVAMTLQATTYTSVAAGWKMVLAETDTPQPLRRLYAIAVGKLFADQVIPVAGMGGNMFLVDRLGALGVGRGNAVATLLVAMIGFYAVYGICALAMLAVLWIKGLASIWIAGFVLVFLVVAIAIPRLALWIRRHGRRPVSPTLVRLASIRALLAIVGEAPKRLLVDRRLIVRVAGVNGLVFLADAGSLMVCFLALGHPVGLPVAFVAVMTASMIATLGPIPLGLGTFEAGATGMLALMGVPVEAALAATLLLRVVTLWLPLVPGFVLIRGALRDKAAQRRA